ncbi:unnamed protein product [Closterium sp. NIES-65]|nr:unnamed protein product [Closterium sp. NIES-65]
MRYAKGLEETDMWQEVTGGIGAEELGGGGEKGSDSGRGGDAEVGGEEAVEVEEGGARGSTSGTKCRACSHLILPQSKRLKLRSNGRLVIGRRLYLKLALSQHSLALHLALLSDIHLLASSGILSMCPPSLQCIGGTFLSSTLHTPLFVLFPSPYPSPFLPYHPLSLLFTSHFPNLSLTLPYPFPPPFLPFPTPFPPVLPPSPPLAFLLPSQARRGGSVAELRSTTPM